MKFPLYILGLLTLSYCSSPENKPGNVTVGSSFAEGFSIKNYPGYRLIEIKRPWQKSQGESYSYILSSDPGSLPDSVASSRCIKTPVKRVVVFSETHIGFISALGEDLSVVGVSGKDYVWNPVVRNSIGTGTCLDIGYAPNIDYEAVLSLKPDLVFIYGLDPSVAGLVKRFEDAGISSVLVSEFLETHPLGKAEWIRFFSAFYEKDNKADSIFNAVKQNYFSLRDSALGLKNKPLVMLGLPWKDTWFMAGGKSFTAQLIKDSGGEYLWAGNTSSEYIPLDLESVFQKSVKADIWINTGTAASLDEILSVDSRFSFIPAFREGNLYNNNARVTESGGNDFWESGSVRPDLVLNDLVRIFHPRGRESEDLKYYRKLQ